MPCRALERTLRYALCIAMAQGLLLCGCKETSEDAGVPLVHNGMTDVWPDSIDLHNGVMLRAIGDTLLQLRVEGNVLRNIRIGDGAAGGFLFESDFPVFDALVRLEASQCRDEKWTQFTPYEIYLNPLGASFSMRVLETRLKNGLVVPEESRLYGWPVVNENPMWLLAAFETFKAGGNRRWLQCVGDVAARVLDEDLRVRCNGETGLFGGVPRYMVGPKTVFPAWMQPSDIFGVQTLGVNGAYWSVLDAMRHISADFAQKNDNARLPELAIDADTLLHSINRELWMPNLGRYSAMVYGNLGCPLQLYSSDNLAQALAVLTSMPPKAMCASVVDKTPVSRGGMMLFTPYINEPQSLPVVQAMWCAAASRAGGDEAYEAAFGGLLDAVAGSLLWGDRSMAHTCRNALSGLVLRGFLGVDFRSDGMTFAPSIPVGMTGQKRVKGLRYRHSRLDITIDGTGDRLVSFAIDGKPAEPFFPASMEGEHHLAITLGDARAMNGRVIVDDGGGLPDPPMVEWPTARHATLVPRVNHATAYSRDDDAQVSGACVKFVYINGVVKDELTSHSYELPDGDATAVVQFVSEGENENVGFSSKPYLYAPQDKRHIVYLASVARGGTKVIENKKISQRFVETDRARNRTLKFDFEAPRAGWYRVDVHYASGLGTVNRRRRIGLRTLWVDGERQGVFVFPQFSHFSQVGLNRDASTDWQTITSFSNPLRVWLDCGMNRIEMRLYQPSPVYADPTANSVVADFVRLVEE